MNTQNLLIALIVLGLAGGAAFFLLSEDESIDVDNTRMAPAEEAPKAREEAPERSASSVETSRFDATMDRPDDLPALEEDGITFALVTNRNGNPVPGATVDLVSTGSRERGRFFGRGSSAPEVYRSVRTNREGFAVLSPLPRQRFRLIAKKDDFVGSTVYTQGEEADDLPPGANVVIVLYPVKRVLVDVVDATGTPAPRIQIEARPKWEESDFRDMFRNMRGGDRGGRGGRGRPDFSGWTVSEWTRTPEGSAVLEVSKVSSMLYEAEKLDIRATLPGLERVTETVTMPPEGDVNVTLRIPETVGVTITLRDSEGKIFKESTRVTWLIEAEPEAESESRRGGRDRGRDRGRGRGGFGGFSMFGGGGPSNFGSHTIEGGRAVIGGFRPNAKVKFTTRVDDRVPETTAVSMNADPAQSFDVLVGGLQPSLAFTLTDPAGDPIVNTRIRVEVNLDTEPEQVVDPNDRTARMAQFLSGRTNRVRTDDEGRGSIGARTGSGGELHVRMESRNFGRGGRGGRGSRGGRGNRGEQAVDNDPPLAVVRFEALKGGEDRDLGEVRLESWAVLASGIVVDENGEPVARARVRTKAFDPAAEEERRGRGDRGGRGGRGGRSNFGGFGGFSWGGDDNFDGPSATTDEDGKFVVYGFARSDRSYKIRADNREAKSGDQEIAPGANDLRLVCLNVGGLRGKVSAHDASLDLRIELRLRKAGAEESDYQRVNVGDDGEFSARRLFPGPYDLEVRVNSVTDTTINGLMVPPGETAEPGAIADLIVGLDYYRAEITVVDPSNAPVEGARVSLTADGRRIRTTSGRGGRDRGERGDRGGRGGRGGRDSQEGRGRGGRGGRGGSRTDDLGMTSAVLKRGAAVKVSVSHDDFARQDIDGAQFPLTVRMLAGEGLILTVSQAPPQPEGMRDWRISLTAPAKPGEEQPDPNDMRAMMRRMFGGGLSKTLQKGSTQVTWNNLKEGTYEVQLIGFPPRSRGQGGGDRGGRGGRGGRGRFTPIVVPLGTVAVKTGQGQQSVTLGIDPRAVNAAIEAAMDPQQ